ncbi:hypothetical protein [Oceaniglobus trochenteri]|uniref:hypothetical protein n=1 Tax=Oceaniglobus trochenteri TaxID=2763260 RepID=UPI001CFFFE0C|nr:hypothetical protein [Oceaniglobus trochenteri]
MTLIADILLIAGAAGAAFYCVILSRRLSRFTDLEKGVGGAIAVLSAQVDDMTRTLQAAQAQASTSGQTLEALTSRAEEAARRLELHVAALHDLETEPDPVQARAPSDVAPTVSFRRKEAEPAPPEAPRPTGSRPVQSFFSTQRQPEMDHR